MAIDEFNVREVLGVASVHNAYNGETASVRLTEMEARITLSIWTPSNSNPPELRPDEARRLARQLYRLARRIEQRRAP